MDKDRQNLEAAWKSWTAAPSLSEEEKELRAWILRNRETLADWEPWEVARLALMNQFSPELVYQVISCLRFALAGSSVENGAILQQFKFEIALSDIERLKQQAEAAKTPNLCLEVWKDLHQFQTGEAA